MPFLSCFARTHAGKYLSCRQLKKLTVQNEFIIEKIHHIEMALQQQTQPVTSLSLATVIQQNTPSPAICDRLAKRKSNKNVVNLLMIVLLNL